MVYIRLLHLGVNCFNRLFVPAQSLRARPGIPGGRHGNVFVTAAAGGNVDLVFLIRRLYAAAQERHRISAGDLTPFIEIKRGVRYNALKDPVVIVIDYDNGSFLVKIIVMNVRREHRKLERSGFVQLGFIGLLHRCVSVRLGPGVPQELHLLVYFRMRIQLRRIRHNIIPVQLQ